jgi:putative transposase
LDRYQPTDLIPVWKKVPGTSFLAEAPSRILQQAAIELTRAFRNFSDCLAKSPKSARKGLDDPFRYPQGFAADSGKSKIRLPKPGWMGFHDSGDLAGAAESVTVRVETDGIHVSVSDGITLPEPLPAQGDSVGIDMGLARFAALSDGAFIDVLSETAAGPDRLDKRRLRLRREAARKDEAAKRKAQAGHKGRKGEPGVPVSKRLGRLYRRIALIDRRRADMMMDFRHKASTAISKNNAVA